MITVILISGCLTQTTRAFRKERFRLQQGRDPSPLRRRSQSAQKEPRPSNIREDRTSTGGHRTSQQSIHSRASSQARDRRNRGESESETSDEEFTDHRTHRSRSREDARRHREEPDESVSDNEVTKVKVRNSTGSGKKIAIKPSEKRTETKSPIAAKRKSKTLSSDRAEKVAAKGAKVKQKGGKFVGETSEERKGKVKSVPAEKKSVEKQPRVYAIKSSIYFNIIYYNKIYK